MFYLYLKIHVFIIKKKFKTLNNKNIFKNVNSSSNNTSVTLNNLCGVIKQN